MARDHHTSQSRRGVLYYCELDKRAADLLLSHNVSPLSWPGYGYLTETTLNTLTHLETPKRFFPPWWWRPHSLDLDQGIGCSCACKIRCLPQFLELGNCHTLRG